MASSSLAPLVTALEHADGTFRLAPHAEHETALVDALGILGNVYGTLDLRRSPEAASQLHDMLDECVRALGQAFGGEHDALTAMTNRIRAVAEMVAPKTSSSRPARAAA